MPLCFLHLGLTLLLFLAPQSGMLNFGCVFLIIISLYRVIDAVLEGTAVLVAYPNGLPQVCCSLANIVLAGPVDAQVLPLHLDLGGLSEYLGYARGPLAYHVV